MHKLGLFFAFVVPFGALLESQTGQGPPIYPLPQSGAGMPVPAWLGRGKTITGHIGGIDPDRIMVRTLDVGNVLCFVDDKTKIHVDKYPLAFADLREGDAVAVKIKEIKGKGPYATEIMPHPDRDTSGSPRRRFRSPRVYPNPPRHRQWRCDT